MTEELRIALDLRVVLATILLFASVLKLTREATEPYALIDSLDIVPKVLGRLFVDALPFVEGGLALWLMWGWQSTYALGVTLLLLVIFVVVLLLAHSAGYRGGCGCFGSGDGDRSGAVDVGFDVLLVLIAMCCVVLNIAGGDSRQSVLNLRTADVVAVVLINGTLAAANLIGVEMDRIRHRLLEENSSSRL